MVTILPLLLPRPPPASEDVDDVVAVDFLVVAFLVGAGCFFAVVFFVAAFLAAAAGADEDLAMILLIG
jgi:hypothetical protein